jgi:preprotein translocase subunit SecY
VLRRLANIFRVPDLRNKVLFTIGIICLYQLGANLPIPGVSWHQVKLLQAKAGASGVLGFLNLFSGGALTRLAVFGLGVMPYITSSIVIQLLTTVIPKLTEWRDQGAVGQKKITQTTRYLTIGLALLQSTGLIYAFHGHDQALLGFDIDLIPKFTIWLGLFMVLILTAGTAFVMWLAELITQRGIGQGMSLLIFANVVAGLPSGGKAVWEEGGPFKFFVIFAVSIGLLFLIVFMDNGQRRIPVTFARRVVGRREMGGNSTYIPLKVNQSGVIPIIFASSVLYIPVLLSNIVPWASFQHFVSTSLTPTNFFYITGDFLSDHRLHVLLRLHRLRAAPTGRDVAPTRWLRAGNPTRYAHREVLRPHALAHHRRRRALSRLRRGDPEHLDGAVEHQPLPLLRHHVAHRGGRVLRDDATDRQPTHDA